MTHSPVIDSLIWTGEWSKLQDARDTYLKMAIEMEASTHSQRDRWTEHFLQSALEAEHALYCRKHAPNAAMHRCLDGSIVWRRIA